MEIWEEDLYELLAVSPEATPEEIKKAYKKLAIELHPDRFPDDPEKRAEATEKFGKITNAYNILKDEEERAEYDFARRMGFGDAAPAPRPGGGTGTTGPIKPAQDDDAVMDAKRSQAENQFEQGKVYHKARNWQKAIACYKESIRLNPTVADVHAHLGVAYQQQGLKTPATNAFAAAYKLDRRNKLVKEHYTPPDEDGKGAKSKGKGKGKGKDAKPGLLEQIMALFGGGAKAGGKSAKGGKDAKGKQPAKKTPAKGKAKAGAKK